MKNFIPVSSLLKPDWKNEDKLPNGLDGRIKTFFKKLAGTIKRN